MDCRQPLSDRNLVGSFLLEERVTEQRLTHHEMMGIKLRSAADPLIIYIVLGNIRDGVSIS